MILTGSYSSKAKNEAKSVSSPPLGISTPTYSTPKPEILQDIASNNLVIDPKNFYPEPPSIQTLERTLSRSKTLDFMIESPGVKIPNAMGSGYSRQGSISNFFANFPILNRQNSFEFFDELNRKLLRQETLTLPNSIPVTTNEGSSNNGPLNPLMLKRENSGIKLFDQQNPLNGLSGLSSKQIMETEEIGNLVMPVLSKKSSAMSQQMPEEQPSFSRFNSSFSFLCEK